MQLDNARAEKNQTFPPLAGSGKCGSSDRPGDGRSRATASSHSIALCGPQPNSAHRLSNFAARTHSETTWSQTTKPAPSGQSSAFADTPRDRQHVTATIRSVRQQSSEACGTVFLGGID